MILEPQGGLCNRLRVILSRLQPGLIVYWAKSKPIAYAAWEHVFEPLEGVQILSADCFSTEADVATCDGAPGVRWQPLMRLVKPLPHIRVRIANLIWEMGGPGNYDAMFIRRTDGRHVAAKEGNYTSDAEFMTFANCTSGPIFLATDNGETQRKVRGWVDGRLVTIGEMGGTENSDDDTRYQSLEDSVVNLYVCCSARKFKGSGGSSFSDTIGWMRELGLT